MVAVKQCVFRRIQTLQHLKLSTAGCQLSQLLCVGTGLVKFGCVFTLFQSDCCKSSCLVLEICLTTSVRGTRTAPGTKIEIPGRQELARSQLAHEKDRLLWYKEGTARVRTKMDCRRTKNLGARLIRMYVLLLTWLGPCTKRPYGAKRKWCNVIDVRAITIA